MKEHRLDLMLKPLKKVCVYTSIAPKGDHHSGDRRRGAFVAANWHNELAADTILAVDRDVPRSVKTLEESFLLLTTALG